jgi:hypothetical protein
MKKNKYYTLLLSYINKVIIPIALIFIISCAKQEKISEIDFQKNLLAGTGAYQNEKHRWKIDSFLQNGTAVNLSTSAKMYYRTFFRNGTTTDRDGLNGIWEMTTVKDLKMTLYTYDINGKIISTITNKFAIMKLNSAQLQLKYDSANFKQELHFISNN